MTQLTPNSFRVWKLNLHKLWVYLGILDMCRHDYTLYEVVGGIEIEVNGLRTKLLVKNNVGHWMQKILKDSSHLELIPE